MRSRFSFCRLLLLIILFSFSLTGCRLNTRQDKFIGVEVSAIEKELKSVLDKWYPAIIDTVNGGYWTNFGYDWTRLEKQDKFLVTQARALWCASKAVSVFSDNEVFKRAADHGYRFLTETMWDKHSGGFYQDYYIDPDHKPDLSYRLVYGNAFALYALSEYAKINTDTSVLNWVRKVFYWLDKCAHDPVHSGYFNIVLPDSKSLTDSEQVQIIKRVNWSPPGWKDQNTSIHLLEALANTCQVWPDELVKSRLAEMMKLVRDTMTHKDGYLHLYFTRDWKPVSFRDSSRAFIMRNLGYDHVSFGHDIETAYLLLEASGVLYGKPDSVTLFKAKKMLEHTLSNGFDADYYGLFDRAYYFRGEGQVEIVDNRKSWWAQAEAWHTLALFSTLYPDEKTYQDAFLKMWNYINNEVIDHKYGEWYNYGLDTSPKSQTAGKAGPWKGCYHNSRALTEVLRMAADIR